MKKKSMKLMLIAIAGACIIAAILLTVNYISKAMNVAQDLPSPKEEEGEDHDKLRDLWWQQMHRAAPGTNWQQIEAANGAMLLQLKQQLRMYNSFGPTPQQETFANGKVVGTWNERGSGNQAG